MKRDRMQGWSLPAVMMLIIVLAFLQFTLLLRVQLGQEQVRNRYLTGVARDLAEDGIEFEKLMLQKGQAAPESAPHREQVGVFANRQGLFSAFARPLGNDEYQVVGEGKIISKNGGLKLSSRIRATVKKLPNGSWQTLDWSEDGSR